MQVKGDYNYDENPFRVLIITCWVLLILCVIAKLFGANYRMAKNFLDDKDAPEGKALKYYLAMKR